MLQLKDSKFFTRTPIKHLLLMFLCIDKIYIGILCHKYSRYPWQLLRNMCLIGVRVYN